MNFAHISDTHFRHKPIEAMEGFPLEKIVDMDGERLRQTLKALKQQSQKPDFVVITGDLVHESSAEDYHLFRELLDEELAETPYYVALGNHDCRTAFWEGFKNNANKDHSFFESYDFNGLRIIVLDSSPYDGCASGQLDTAQLDWLQIQLQQSALLGTIILMHHPIELVYEKGYSQSDKHGLVLSEGFETLSSLLEGSDVLAVFSGHTHFPSASINDGIMYITAAGTAFGLNPAKQDSMIFQNSASYYNCRINQGKVCIGQVNMPFPGDTIFSIDLETIAKSV